MFECRRITTRIECGPLYVKECTSFEYIDTTVQVQSHLRLLWDLTCRFDQDRDLTSFKAGSGARADLQPIL